MLLRLVPIVSQLSSVKLGPIEHQSNRSAWKFSFDDFQRLDSNFGFVLPIDRVKVRGCVVVIVHSDHDSKKDAQRWHRVAILLCLPIFVSDGCARLVEPLESPRHRCQNERAREPYQRLPSEPNELLDRTLQCMLVFVTLLGSLR